MAGLKVSGVTLYFLPVSTRMPLKFGPETLTSVTCARVRVRVEGPGGRSALGWGETPLSVQWAWPSALPYEGRHGALKEFTLQIARAWSGLSGGEHALELGWTFQQYRLPRLWREFNDRRLEAEPMPWLAAMVASSAFDIALHDAYGVLKQIPAYAAYGGEHLRPDLASFLEPAKDSRVSFWARRPADFLVREPPVRLPAWHLVGGRDPIREEDLDGTEPRDGYPVLLRDWIRADGLRCLKVKLRGDDQRWDYDRMVSVGRIAIDEGVLWLSADFNCTVTDPEYVNEILDKLRDDEPRIYGMLLYVEQPFPYDLEKNQIDVRSVSARKPLFMDESAHDWRLLRLGRSLGWSGVALKTCKTQTGALLALSWAKAHGMAIMVQDLTNPMLAQIPHALLAAHAGTICGVETNSMQFYPEASRPEAEVHPGLYRRRDGMVDLSTLRGPGFGYRVDEIRRKLPDPAFSSE